MVVITYPIFQGECKVLCCCHEVMNLISRLYYGSGTFQYFLKNPFYYSISSILHIERFPRYFLHDLGGVHLVLFGPNHRTNDEQSVTYRIQNNNTDYQRMMWKLKAEQYGIRCISRC